MQSPDIKRRRLIIGGAAIALSATVHAKAPAKQAPADPIVAKLAELETRMGGRLGVSAFDVAGNKQIAYRADERFPVCSTFKAILAGAILDRSRSDAGLLDKHIDYSANDLVAWSPVTEKNIVTGMNVAALCAAALQYSDNTAANLLMRQIGGPEGLTAYARRIGNPHFRLDRWETELNSAIPGDVRDTATPASMMASLYQLQLGNALPEKQREQLKTWMLGNTTGAKRIRAGVPADWKVSDRTGSGDYGTANDIAVLWPPGREPIVLAIYHTHADPKSTWNDAIHAEATRIVLSGLDIS